MGFLVGDASIRHLRFGEADATAVTSALTAAIGARSTLGQVKAAMTGVTTSDDSLGPEFISTSGLGGMLTGLTAGSTVKLTYAGETCFFR